MSSHLSDGAREKCGAVLGPVTFRDQRVRKQILVSIELDVKPQQNI